MMPKLDGLALARALRERPDAPPILLISAKVSQADRAAALAVADGWLPKPFSSTALRAEIQRLAGAGLLPPTVSASESAVGMSRAWFTRMYRAWCGHSPGEDTPQSQ